MVVLYYDGEACHYEIASKRLTKKIIIPKCKYFSSCETGYSYIRKGFLYFLDSSGTLAGYQKVSEPVSIHCINPGSTLLVYSTKLMLATPDQVSEVVDDYFGKYEVYPDGRDCHIVTKKVYYIVRPDGSYLKQMVPKCGFINIGFPDEPKMHIKDNLYESGGKICVAHGKFIRKTSLPAREPYITGVTKIESYQQYFSFDYGLTKVICNDKEKVMVSHSYKLLKSG